MLFWSRNNAINVVGVGEREGRVYSRLVYDRHFGMSHGIGRSGTLMDVQPKAAGSSILNRLTQYLAQDILHYIGLKVIKQIVNSLKDKENNSLI